MQLTALDKPIGYWIKKADEVLTHRVDSVQQEFGLNRLGWQLLHTVCTHPPLKDTVLADMVAPFAPVAEVQRLLSSMIDRGLLAWDDILADVPTCTSAGMELHQRCLAEQTIVRQQAMDGVSNEQYALAVETLQAIVTNLGDDHKF